MSYIDFMREINIIVSKKENVARTILEVKRQALTLGIILETNLEVIQLIEIAKKYNVKMY